MTPIRLYCGGYTGSIFELAFDPERGTLDKVRETRSAGEAPTWLILTEDGEYLYVIDEWVDMVNGDLPASPNPAALALHSFTVSRTGELTLLNSAPSAGGLSTCHGIIHNHALLTASYFGRSITSTPILLDGSLDSSSQQSVDFTNHGSNGPHPGRQLQDHPHAIEVDPTGEWAVVPDLGTDELKLLSVDERGRLDVIGTEKVAPGDGPRHVLFAKNGRGETLVYVINELSNSISVYSFEYSSPPRLHILQPSVSLLPDAPHPHQPDFGSWHCAELKLTPDYHLLASNRADDHAPLSGTAEGPADLLADFEVDPSSGLLVPDSRVLRPAGGRAARHFSLSSESLKGVDGDWVAIALHDSDEVVVFDRSGGGWREVAKVGDVGRPACVLWA